MRMGSLEFRPGRWPSLITLILFGILMSLGFWQLDRAAQKRTLLAAYDGGGDDTVVQIDAHSGALAGMQYRFASANGRYDPAHQFLLDNRTHQGVAGYQVLSVLRLADGEKGLLVNRGWIPLGASREHLPELPLNDDWRQVVGRIKHPSSAGFRLGEEQPRNRWPYRIQFLDLERLAGELGYPLLPLVLLLNPDQTDGFVREWNPLTFGPERNVGYAVQWFGLAAALLVIYIFVNLKQAGES
jgi:surfeit locus 1 family protein